MLQGLLYGRHCLVKECGQLEHEMEPFVHIAPDARAFRELIEQLYTEPFGDREIQFTLELRGAIEADGRRIVRLHLQIGLPRTGSSGEGEQTFSMFTLT